MASLWLANWALWRALNWYNRDAIFYFPPDFAVFCYFHSELFRCNPPVFRCFLLFQNGYKSTPLCLPAGGVYDSESILSARLRED
ncbi:Hypothetical protein B819_98756 [Klebsiella pneumoniae subsp. pneumoniae KpQ3]|nr:Hypothetical protein B819_98756 [Klebsiella pneumoniae subsp. pneumoniae KpQ3]ESB01123.1 hypothetical protein HMPREF1619_02686 [Klebsiella pneumoniae 909957]